LFFKFTADSGRNYDIEAEALGVKILGILKKAKNHERARATEKIGVNHIYL
jgi:hypothetical protein